MKLRVGLSTLDVFGDSGAHDFGDRLIVNGGDCVKFLCLLSREPNGHGLRWFHVSSLPFATVVVNHRATVVSW